MTEQCVRERSCKTVRRWGSKTVHGAPARKQLEADQRSAELDEDGRGVVGREALATPRLVRHRALDHAVCDALHGVRLAKIKVVPDPEYRCD